MNRPNALSAWSLAARGAAIVAAAVMLLLGSALPVPAVAAAATARERLLIDADVLARRLEEKHLVILQVGNPETYAAGHIPRAQLLAQGMLQRPRGNDPSALLLELPDPKALQAQLQMLGIERNSHVVVVFGKDEVTAATRVVYTLDAAGWGDKVSLLDGGQPEWVRRGHPLTTETPVVARTALSPPKVHPDAVDLRYLQDHPPGKHFVLIDARAREFYDGTQRSRYPSGEAPAGHLPGARSLPFSAITSSDLKLKPTSELSKLFADAGVKKGDKVVVYCHIGQQASAVLFAARLAGIDASLYDGSFQEWTSHGLPVQTTAP